MGSSRVVPIDVLGNVLFGLAHRLIRPQIDPLILDRAPDALHKDVISPSPPTIHGELDPMALNHVHERLSGELAALVGVDNLRPAKACKRLCQRFDRMNRLQRDRCSVCQDSSAVNIDHGCEVNKALFHADIGRIQRPDLVAAVDHQFAKQVRKHFVLRVVIVP